MTDRARTIEQYNQNQQEDFGAKHIPTPEEIVLGCHEIRKSWSPADWRERRVIKECPARVAHVSVAARSRFEYFLDDNDDD